MKLGKFHDNVCNSKSPQDLEAVKLSVSISEDLAETAQVLVSFGHRKSVSAVVEDALRAYFELQDAGEEIIEAYKKWEKHG